MVSFNWIIHSESFEICQVADIKQVWEQLRDYDGFFSLARTQQEISVVSAEGCIKNAVTRSSGWRLLELEGPLDLQLTGIMAEATGVLAKAEISIFALATYDTDYVMVQSYQLESALSALHDAGHSIVSDSDDD